MKIKPAVALSLLLALAAAPRLHAREVISLNGTWQAQYAAETDKPPTDQWFKADVPGLLSIRRDTLHVWYRRSFTVPGVAAALRGPRAAPGSYRSR